MSVFTFLVYMMFESTASSSKLTLVIKSWELLTMGFPMALIGIRSEIALEKITCNVLKIRVL